MANSGYSLFPTAIGSCGIAWSGIALIGTQLPEKNVGATRTRLRGRFPNLHEVAPPARIRSAIAAMTALLSGKGGDLSAIELDDSRLPPFQRMVYAAARQIPAGTTVTYGEIAKRIGAPGSARAVGQALGRNPYPIVVPCHRVLAAGGKLGGFTAEGGVSTKQRMLAIEGAVPSSANLSLFDLAGRPTGNPLRAK